MEEYLAREQRRYGMKISDEEFDYRKPMPKKEKRRRKLLHKIQVLRNKNKD